MNIKTVETVLNHLHSEDPIQLSIYIAPDTAQALIKRARALEISPEEMASSLLAWELI